MKTDNRSEQGEMPKVLIEGEDFYLDDGLMVLTAKFLRDRGYCCENGCRHCPYPAEDDAKSEQVDG